MAPDGAVALAAGCTIGASAIAIWHIYMHLRNYTEPTYQRYTVRIIFMIHVYALMSFLSLVAPMGAIFFNSISGMYEAWVIYNFLSLCLAWVGGPGVVATSLHGRFLKPSWHLMTCCCDAIPLDGIFIRRCKQCVLQFVIMKPILVFVTLVLYGSGLYEDGSFSAGDGYLYITLVYTISYTGALAALVLFYVACKDLLRPFYPFSKFVIIKSVVFLTFWQGVLISVLASGDVLSAQESTDVQNIVICVEMLFAAVAHLYAFPYSTYAEANIGMHGSLVSSIHHALNFSDVVDDTLHQFAPTYHEYVLYSDGSQEAPQRYRVRTFVPTGKEMEPVTRNATTQKPDPKDMMDLENRPAPTNPASPRTIGEAVVGRDPPSYGEMFGPSNTLYDDTSSFRRPPPSSVAMRKSNNPTDLEFNPRALETPETRRAALMTYDHMPSWTESMSKGKQKYAASEVVGQSTGGVLRRTSCTEEEADENTKLTERRASEQGSFMDTIDLSGENDEYSEGFIQR